MNNKPGQYQSPLPPPQAAGQPPQQYQPQAPGSYNQPGVYGPPQVGQYGSQQQQQQYQQQPPQPYQPQAPGSYNQPGQYGNYQQQPPQQYQQYQQPPQQYQQQPPQQYQQYQQPPQQQYQPQAPGSYGVPPQVVGQYGVPPPQQFQQQRPPVPSTVGGGVSLVKFFDHVKNRYARDYTLIIDKSGSMSGSLWKQAEAAVAKIAPFAVSADPDGITVFFFSSPTSKHPKYDNIKDANMVMGLFAREKAGGTTDLYGVLNQAIDDHFKRGGKPETMLVITDGIPNSESDVKKLIVKTTKKLQRDEDLSISFIQIGNDRSASKFLQKLDDDLTKEGAKFDIVDTLSAEQMKSMTFEQLIDKSIMD